MRERIVCGAQTMSMPGPDTQEPATGPARNGGERLFPPGQSEEAATGSNPAPAPSPLTTFLTRRELVPFVLELEKSLLVSREHDYAKAPDRLAILQATTLLERKTEGAVNGGEARTTSRAELCDELLNCRGELGRLRRSAPRSEENATCRHLRAVVGVQAALIREQQEQLYCKDRELASIRKDRDQLEARLERMERRLAVHQKRNTAAVHESDPAPSTPSPLGVTRRHSRTESLILSERNARSRSSSLERSRNRVRLQQQSSNSSSPVSLDERKSARKRLRTDDNSVVAPESVAVPVKRVRKPPKLAEIRTSVEYAGLGLLPTHDGLVPLVTANHTDCMEKSSEALLNDTLCPAAPNALSDSLLSSETVIVVPSWELHPLQPLEGQPVDTDLEDLSEDAFLRRHKKHEEDEKRRKRWDLQRARALLEHQELLKKYNKKSGASEPVDERRDKIASFSPNLEDIEEIEILPTVAVSAFGHPLPLLKRSEFELPCFDLVSREARENVRTTRSKARTSQAPGGCLDDV